jgi:hypothetical protein
MKIKQKLMKVLCACDKILFLSIEITRSRMHACHITPIEAKKKKKKTLCAMPAAAETDLSEGIQRRRQRQRFWSIDEEESRREGEREKSEENWRKLLHMLARKKT